MITFEILIDEKNNLIMDIINEDNSIKEIYNTDALKVFNRIIKLDNKKMFKCEKNGNDRYFYGLNNNKIYVIFRDYEKTIDRIYTLKKEILKPICTGLIVGVAGIASIGFLAIELLKKNEQKKISSILDGETISIDINNNLSNDNKEEIEILDEDVVEENNVALTVFCEVEPKYDKGIINNIEKYTDYIKYACDKWGVSYELMVNIIMQESSGGDHINKTQVTFSEWKDQVLKVYNYNENKYEKLILTDTPEKYSNIEYVITEQDFENPFTNISVGTAVFAYIYSNYCSHNLPLSIQMYNFGYGSMQKVLNEASLRENISKEDIINNEANICFMNYTYVKPDDYGDHSYLYNILKQTTDNSNIISGKEYTMKYIDKFGNIETKTTRFESTYLIDEKVY